jgi:hypothetical protein
MADKPGAKKPAAGGGGGFISDADAATRIMLLLLGLAIIGAVAVRLQRLVVVSSKAGEPSVGGFLQYLFVKTGILESIYRLITDGPFFWTSMGISLLCATLGVYFFVQFYKVRKGEAEVIAAFEAKLVADGTGIKNERWERVQALVASENPADWRVAIIEADVFLFELMKSMGYHGDGLGDMLKAVEKSDFATLDLAWEAHKIRNRIAHHGSDFILTNREAKRVIDLYRQVFEEFSAL